MNFTQARELANLATKEVIGEEYILKEDFSNINEFGGTIEEKMGYDAYVKSVSNLIGKEKFYNRVYKSILPSLMKESWEFASILRKHRGKMPEAVDDESWNLQDGQSYPQDVFHQPDVTEKFWNSRWGFSEQQSIAKDQVKQSFRSADDMAAFFSMIEINVTNSINTKIDMIALGGITGLAASHIAADNGITTIHLITEFNDLFNENLTMKTAQYDPEFLRYLTSRVKEVAGFMRLGSVDWGLEGDWNTTPSEKLHCVMLDKLNNNIGIYLYDANGQFNTTNLAIDSVETIPCWQGVKTINDGTASSYKIEDISKIHIVNNGVETEKSGLACVLFDDDAVALCNQTQEVDTTPFNAVGRFYTNVYHIAGQIICDKSQNAAVFLLD